MDISVSRLNKRMALQLPAEFPLGLVFVVGKIRDLANMKEENGPPFFYISENGYMLRCQLAERALEGIRLNEGDMIRAGGHLAFDMLQADYFLLARDIELLPEQRPSRTTLAPILADIKKRSDAASLAPAELPDWVQRIAPPEILEAKEQDEPNGKVPETAEPEPEPLAEEPADEEEFLPGGLTNDLVDFLSEAMDSPEDVELTHEMVADLAPAIGPGYPKASSVRPNITAPEQKERRVPWAIVFLILFFLISVLSLILTFAIIAAR
jgi:hypothetical protein